MMNYSHQNGADPSNNNRDLDPIEWGILAVIIGGCSLLLSLEQKIEARRKSEAAETERKAIYGNRLRLKTIRIHLSELHSFLAHMEQAGKIEIIDPEPGIASGCIVFHSDETQETFNFRFDEATYAISRINRIINEMDLQGFPFAQKDIEHFVKQPLKQMKDLAWKAINPNTHPAERVSLVRKLLEQHEGFLENMESILRSD